MKITLEDFLKSSSLEDKTTEDEKKKKLVEELEEIEQAYKNSPYMTINGKKIAKTEELSYEPLTDEEIEKTATATVNSEAEEAKKKLNDSADKKIETLSEKKAETLKNAEESAVKIAEKTESAKENAENQALKRGIGRSSIISEELKDLDKASIDALGKVYGEVNGQIAKIDESISALQTELIDALDALDGETAVKINERIKTLKAERDKKAEEVKKYNNSLREKSAEKLNAMKIKGDEKDSDEYIESNANKIKKLYSYYYSLGEEAKEELSSDEDFIKKYVGTNGYNYLKNLLVK